MKLPAAFFLLAAGLTAQPSPVLQTETREVLVDAIVTSKSGAYVSDLSAKDFHISQDGKEQTIRGFSLESASANAQPRSLVLFFDETSMEPRDQVAARQAAAAFIDAEAAPNHRMAIVAFNGAMRIAQGFTDNAGRLKDALNQASFHGLAPSAADSDQSHDPDRAVHDRLTGRGVGLANAFGTRNMIRALADLAKSLGVLPGRKIVVLFTGTLSADARSEERDAVEAASKSGVAFYGLDTRPVFAQTDPGSDSITPASRSSSGGYPGRGGPGGALGDSDPLDRPAADSGSNSQQLLYSLANGTGGFVVRNASDLLPGLQSIGKEQDEYYALTYLPPESKEGSCHQIKVKVDRKQTTVRARTTYCVEKPLDLLAGTTAGKELDERASAGQAGDIGAFMETPYFYAAPNIARVDVAMEIEAEKLKFDNRKGKPHAELNFLGTATGADGQVHARFSDTLKLDFDDPSQVENLKGKSLHYEKEFKIAPGQYTLTVAFSQAEAGFGKLTAPLDIEPWTGGLGLSALVLSRETHPAADLGLAPTLEGRTPLVTEGMQVIPSGAWNFSKSEPAFFYFELYGPEAAMARVHVRILDRKTGEQKWDGGSSSVSAPDNAGKSFIPAGAKLPLDSLSPGAYQLEVVAADSSGRQIKRTADFTVAALP